MLPSERFVRSGVKGLMPATKSRTRTSSHRRSDKRVEEAASGCDLPNVVVSLAALLAAFLAGRWTTYGGASAGAAARRLADVAPEVAEALYSPPAGHGEVAVPS
eukprot:6500733-Prymnesium_polylepis.1